MRILRFILPLYSLSLAQDAKPDISSLLAQWSEIAPTITQSMAFPTEIPTRLGNVDAPPTSLMLAIFTGVPQTVLAQLVNSDARSSIAADFAAGNTPAWYGDLPSGVKSYLQSINAAIKTGGNDYTPPPAEATGGVADAGQGGEGEDEDDEGLGSRLDAVWAACLAGVVGVGVLAVAL